jgi:hypothetical protein
MNPRFVTTMTIAVLAACLAGVAGVGQTDKPSPRWTAVATRSGGIAGEITSVTVTSDGRLALDRRMKEPCTQTLAPALLASIEGIVSKARPDTWKPSYADPKNPFGCCDQFQSDLQLERVAADGRRLEGKTMWHEDASRAPAEARQLFAALMEARSVCEMK